MKKVMLVVLILSLLVFGCTTKQPPKEEIQCGGIAGLKCPDGYECQYQDADEVADAAGYCTPVNDSNSTPKP